MSMLERAQVALANELLRQIKENRADGVAAVRVVIESLRDASPDMKVAGADAWQESEAASYADHLRAAHRVWQAMIDTALSTETR